MSSPHHPFKPETRTPIPQGLDEHGHVRRQADGGGGGGSGDGVVAQAEMLTLGVMEAMAEEK
eukprot:6903317-Prorocentrum_lima.AAC.1